MTTKVNETVALVAALEKLLRSRQQQFKDGLEAVEAGLNSLTRVPEAITFRVLLTSLWADHGEKPMESKGKELPAAIKRAEKRFKIVNNRSDVQAKYQAWALIGNSRVPSYTVPIPDEFIQLHRERR